LLEVIGDLGGADRLAVPDDPTEFAVAVGLILCDVLEKPEIFPDCDTHALFVLEQAGRDWERPNWELRDHQFRNSEFALGRQWPSIGSTARMSRGNSVVLPADFEVQSAWSKFDLHLASSGVSYAGRCPLDAWFVLQLLFV
jgi:hypothetical protein